MELLVNEAEIDQMIEEKLNQRAIDFIDAGCGIGGSIDFCKYYFEVKVGIGFDLNEKKIEQAQNNGYLVFCRNILNVNFPPKSVLFSSMMDFLEHLPNINSAKEILKTLGNASENFLFIRHPNFDDISYLKKYGLKLSWTDWTGHTNMMTIADFCNVFNEFGWKNYRIIPKRLIRNSQDDAILPENAPKDTVKFSQLEGYKKENINFEKPIFYQYDIFVKLNDEMPNEVWDKITSMTQR